MSAHEAAIFPSSVALRKSEVASPWATALSMFFTDFLALTAVYALGITASVRANPSIHLRFYLELFPGIAVFLATFLVHGLYPGLLVHPAEEIRRVCHASATLFFLIGSMMFFWHDSAIYTRSIFLFVWAAGLPVAVLARYVARLAFSRSTWWGIPAVVLGSGPAARRVITKLRDARLGIRVVGVLTEHPGSWSHDLPPVLGTLDAAPLTAALGIARYAVLALPYRSNHESCQLIQHCCKSFRHVLLIPDLPGLGGLGLAARDIGGEVGFELPQRLFQPGAMLIKRALDIAGSATALIVLSPVFLILAAVIKFTSKGPVFYRHCRFGRSGQAFDAFKFRTMVRNAPELLDAYLRSHPDQCEEWERDQKLRRDPRVTAIGKWLRRYSLDELPQLWNVLRGDMSMVGPRPIVKAEIPKYGDGFDLYTRVYPGISGLWQVSGRNDTTYEERVALDEYYVRNWSIWLDAYILIRTVRVVLKAEGAY